MSCGRRRRYIGPHPFPPHQAQTWWEETPAGQKVGGGLDAGMIPSTILCVTIFHACLCTVPFSLGEENYCQNCPPPRPSLAGFDRKGRGVGGSGYLPADEGVSREAPPPRRFSIFISNPALWGTGAHCLMQRGLGNPWGDPQAVAVLRDGQPWETGAR